MNDPIYNTLYIVGRIWVRHQTNANVSRFTTNITLFHRTTAFRYIEENPSGLFFFLLSRRVMTGVQEFCADISNLIIQCCIKILFKNKTGPFFTTKKTIITPGCICRLCENVIHAIHPTLEVVYILLDPRFVSRVSEFQRLTV